MGISASCIADTGTGPYVAHTSSINGGTYYLHKLEQKTKPLFVFYRDLDRMTAMKAVPDGYKIIEDKKTGIPFLLRLKPENSNPSGSSSPTLPSELRLWTDATGRTVNAKLLRVNTGPPSTIEIMREDGKKFVLSIANLSAADQDFLRSFQAGGTPTTD